MCKTIFEAEQVEKLGPQHIFEESGSHIVSGAGSHTSDKIRHVSNDVCSECQI